jgi:hypothetical protein
MLVNFTEARLMSRLRVLTFLRGCSRVDRCQFAPAVSIGPGLYGQPGLGAVGASTGFRAELRGPGRVNCDEYGPEEDGSTTMRVRQPARLPGARSMWRMRLRSNRTFSCKVAAGQFRTVLPWLGPPTLPSSLAKSGFSGNSATSSVSCVRATSVFFSRRAAKASRIFANGRR